jgi:hypothetical protein
LVAPPWGGHRHGCHAPGRRAIPFHTTIEGSNTTARFPKRESDVATLAQDMVAGLTAHTTDFPSPPVPPDELQTALAEYSTAREAAIVGTANATQGTAAKDEALETLVDLMKADLREGAGWVFLDWKEPTEGGPVPAYKGQRRTRRGRAFRREEVKPSTASPEARAEVLIVPPSRQR